MQYSIASVLMERDGMTQQEADVEVEAARKDLHERLKAGEMPYDICNEWFGLEPDYLDGLLPI